MRLAAFTFVLLVLASSSSSCVVHVDRDGDANCFAVWGGAGETIRGSGVAATQAREVDAFSSVELDGSGFAHVVLSPERSVRLTADDNLIDHVRTRVADGRLIVDFERGSYSFRTPLRIEITTPTLQGVALNGSGDVEIEGLVGGDFKAGIAGSGSLKASGRCDRLEASIAGSGDLKLRELESRDAIVRISGSGDARINALETLDVRISGSGDVRYQGTPRVTKSIAGSGSVARD